MATRTRATKTHIATTTIATKITMATETTMAIKTTMATKTTVQVYSYCKMLCHFFIPHISPEGTTGPNRLKFGMGSPTGIKKTKQHRQQLVTTATKSTIALTTKATAATKLTIATKVPPLKATKKTSILDAVPNACMTSSWTIMYGEKDSVFICLYSLYFFF